MWPLTWILVLLLLTILALIMLLIIVSIVLYLYSFYFAPRFLFPRLPQTEPYTGQAPPPFLFRAFLGEVHTGFLFFSTYLLGLVVKGTNLGPDQNLVPVLLVHGYAVSRSSWIWFARNLKRAGVNRPMYYLGFNWLSPIERAGPRLAALIEKALSEQGVDQVDIVSHSWGGFLSRWCIEELNMGSQVRKLITISTPHQGTWGTRLGFGSPRRDMMIGSPVVRLFKTAPPKPRYAQIWSDCDEIVAPPQFSLLDDPDGNKVFTRQFRGVSHLAILQKREVAELVARLLDNPRAWRKSSDDRDSDDDDSER